MSLWQPTRGILQPNQHWRRPQTTSAPPASALGISGSVMNFGGASADPQVINNYSNADADCIVVICLEPNGAPILGITDDSPGGPLNWQLLNGTGIVGGEATHLWWAHSPNQLTNVDITIDQTSSAFIAGSVFSVKGADTADPWDDVDGSNKYVVGFSAGVLFDTTVDDTFVIHMQRTGDTTPTANTAAGWTAINTNAFIMVQYQIFNSIQTNTEATDGEDRNEKNVVGALKSA